MANTDTTDTVDSVKQTEVHENPSRIDGLRVSASIEPTGDTRAKRLTAPNGEVYDHRFIASTERLASDGGVILLNAWDLNEFMKRPRFIVNHDLAGQSGQPLTNIAVGRVVYAAIEDGFTEAQVGRGGRALVCYVRYMSTAFAQEIKTLYEEGGLDDVSVRWDWRTEQRRPPNAREMEMYGSDLQWVAFYAELVELSAVLMGADPGAQRLRGKNMAEAIARCRSKGLSLPLMEQLVAGAEEEFDSETEAERDYQAGLLRPGKKKNAIYRPKISIDGQTLESDASTETADAPVATADAPATPDAALADTTETPSEPRSSDLASVETATSETVPADEAMAQVATTGESTRESEAVSPPLANNTQRGLDAAAMADAVDALRESMSAFDIWIDGGQVLRQRMADHMTAISNLIALGADATEHVPAAKDSGSGNKKEDEERVMDENQDATESHERVEFVGGTIPGPAAGDAQGVEGTEADGAEMCPVCLEKAEDCICDGAGDGVATNAPLDQPGQETGQGGNVDLPGEASGMGNMTGRTDDGREGTPPPPPPPPDTAEGTPPPPPSPPDQSCEHCGGQMVHAEGTMDDGKKVCPNCYKEPARAATEVADDEASTGMVCPKCGKPASKENGQMVCQKCGRNVAECDCLGAGDGSSEDAPRSEDNASEAETTERADNQPEGANVATETAATVDGEVIRALMSLMAEIRDGLNELRARGQNPNADAVVEAPAETATERAAEVEAEAVVAASVTEPAGADEATRAEEQAPAVVPDESSANAEETERAEADVESAQADATEAEAEPLLVLFDEAEEALAARESDVGAESLLDLSALMAEAHARREAADK